MACVLASTMALISVLNGPQLHAVKTTANKGMPVPVLNVLAVDRAACRYFDASGHQIRNVLVE